MAIDSVTSVVLGHDETVMYGVLVDSLNTFINLLRSTFFSYPYLH